MPWHCSSKSNDGGGGGGTAGTEELTVPAPEGVRVCTASTSSLKGRATWRPSRSTGSAAASEYTTTGRSLSFGRAARIGSCVDAPVRPCGIASFSSRGETVSPARIDDASNLLSITSCALTWPST